MPALIVVASVFFSGIGSGVSDVDVAMLVTSPGPSTRAVTGNDWLAPEASEPAAHVTVLPATAQPGAESSVRLAGSVSETCAFTATLGPWFVSCSVKTTVPPASGAALSANFVRSRSAAGITTDSNRVLLFDGAGSPVVESTTAEFDTIVPAVDSASVPPTAIVASAPDAIVPRLQRRTLSGATTVHAPGRASQT